MYMYVCIYIYIYIHTLGNTYKSPDLVAWCDLMLLCVTWLCVCVCVHHGPSSKAQSTMATCTSPNMNRTHYSATTLTF